MEVTEAVEGRLAFQGLLHPKEASAKPIRGVWNWAADGVIAHIYETYDSDSGTWNPFFSGRSVPILTSKE